MNETEDTKTWLKRKSDGMIGTLEYSMFGGSVHFIDEVDGVKYYGKTIGNRLSEIYKEWEEIECPKNYFINKNGWPEHKIYIHPDENGNDVEWVEVLRGNPDKRKPEWMFRTDGEYREYLKNYREEG